MEPVAAEAELINLRGIWDKTCAFMAQSPLRRLNASFYSSLWVCREKQRLYILGVKKQFLAAVNLMYSVTCLFGYCLL